MSEYKVQKPLLSIVIFCINETRCVDIFGKALKQPFKHAAMY